MAPHEAITRSWRSIILRSMRGAADMAGRGSPEWRLAVIEEALKSGNVRAICKRERMDRTTFYKLKRRIDGLPRDEQLKALEDRPRKWRTHGQQTPQRERRAIVAIALKHPVWGCNRIQAELMRKGIKKAASTVQKIISDEGVGTQRDRWLALDRPDVEHSAEQHELVATYNPSVKDRERRAKGPGDKIDIGYFKAGKLPALGHVVIIVAVDRFSSYAFGSIRRKFTKEYLNWLLDERLRPALARGRISNASLVLPKGLPVGDNFKRRDFKIVPRVRSLGAGGSVQRFEAAVTNDFLKEVAAEQVFDELKDLQQAFKRWLAEYNAADLHGFPNYGRSPASLFGISTR